jgi:hypothetical protein
MKNITPPLIRSLITLCFLPVVARAGQPVCETASGERMTPVVELYTSEGCSSCPPADQWLSTLKGKPVVAQAFHVAYWDYIGWKDRFASPEFTLRQKDLAQANGLGSIYTPQLVKDGKDWRSWRLPLQKVEASALSRAGIRLRQGETANQFEAQVTPVSANAQWTAYWTVTEHNHNSRVKAGENAGEFLKHDFVVRQYVQAGQYAGTQSLKFYSIAPQADHPRQINLVVSDARTGEPMQALSLSCS